MDTSLFVSGFKCFIDSEFKLKDVTLLTGSNGTGKSSLIQAILLIRLGVEKNSQDLESHHYIGSTWKGIPVPLNDGFGLNLGTIYDIFNNNEYSRNVININLDDERFEITLPDNEEDEISVNINLVTRYNRQEIIPLWRKREFYYLNTERLGPRLGLDFNYTDFPHCGYKGESTAQVLISKGLTHKVTDARLYTGVKSTFLQQQVDGWLNEICPGTQGVNIKSLGTMRGQITLKSSSVQREVLPTNIGFGISYALPIIVNGLIAEKGSLFIVENPEAHLHPKGQSNIGYFLGLVACAGVKIIIETHSEHVVNGVRRASLSSKGINPTDVGIYFFSANSTGGKREVSIGESGDLKTFPKDFFDQVNQDMAEINRLKSKMKNG